MESVSVNLSVQVLLVVNVIVIEKVQDLCHCTFPRSIVTAIIISVSIPVLLDD
jgi:hypothetical protein